MKVHLKINLDIELMLKKILNDGDIMLSFYIKRLNPILNIDRENKKN